MPLRLAALGERGGALDLVRVTPHLHEVLPAGAARVAQAQLERAPQRTFREHHRGGRVPGDLLGELLRGVAQLLRRLDDLADDAQLVGARRAGPLVAARQRHAEDGLHRRLPDQRDRLVRADLADRHVRVAELGARRSDGDVRVGDEVQPAAGADAVHRRDHGLADADLPRGEAQLEVARPA